MSVLTFMTMMMILIMILMMMMILTMILMMIPMMILMTILMMVAQEPKTAPRRGRTLSVPPPPPGPSLGGGAYKFPGFGSRLGEGKGEGKQRCSNTHQDPRRGRRIHPEMVDIQIPM